MREQDWGLDLDVAAEEGWLDIGYGEGVMG